MAYIGLIAVLSISGKRTLSVLKTSAKDIPEGKSTLKFVGTPE